MDGEMHRKMDSWTDEQTDEWTTWNGRTDRQMDGRTGDGQSNGHSDMLDWRTDRRMSMHMNIHTLTNRYS